MALRLGLARIAGDIGGRLLPQEPGLGGGRLQVLSCPASLNGMIRDVQLSKML